MNNEPGHGLWSIGVGCIKYYLEKFFRFMFTFYRTPVSNNTTFKIKNDKLWQLTFRKASG